MIFLAEEMSDDERFTMIAGGILALIGVVHWYAPLASVTRLARSGGSRRLLASSPVIAAGVLMLALTRFSAVEVRTDFRYILLFLFVGVAWLEGLHLALPWLGISPREDAVENGNTGAAVAVCGAQLGLMLSYAGGSMGEGPTIWTTIGPAALAGAVLIAIWFAVEQASHVAEAVTVERDTASGVRLAGMLVACGLVLGRAVAGDWESSANTVRDFVNAGWPAAVIAAIASVVQRLLRPTEERPLPPLAMHGLLPAAAYIFLAAAWVTMQGDWRSIPMVAEPSP